MRPASTLAGQRVHQDDGAFGLELLRRLLTNLFLDARGAEHLQRPHVEERRARHRRPAAQPLDRDRRNAVLREEHRRRQPDQASPREQDRNLFHDACLLGRNHAERYQNDLVRRKTG